MLISATEGDFNSHTSNLFNIFYIYITQLQEIPRKEPRIARRKVRIWTEFKEKKSHNSEIKEIWIAECELIPG